MPEAYLEMDAEGGDHVSDEEQASSGQGSSARSNALQPWAVEGSGETKEADSKVEGHSGFMLYRCLLCSNHVEAIQFSVDGVIEDGPGIERTANGLEDECSREHEPAVVGHVEYSLLLSNLLWCASKESVAVVPFDEAGKSSSVVRW